tara:strand:+ start:5840 stop:9832 length:3993 start_codon:yes stop_codon:yes gene_type:complete
MAKKKQVYIDVVIDDKGTTKRVAVNAKALGIELEKTGVGADKAAKGTDQLNKNSQTLNRNLKGTGKQSSNTTKNFSKMQQGMGGLVGAYASLAAQIFAVSAAFQFLQSAAQLKNLTAGQEALGAATGTAYRTITQSVIEATDAQLGFLEASQAVSIGTAAGLTSSQLTDLATAAKNTSAALGRDLTDSFNRLIRGVTKAEPELLDELGIILRLDTATRAYAEAVGQSVGDLTAWQRTQAVTNDVLEQAESKFGMMEDLMDQDALALNQFARSFDELVNSLKEGVLEKLAPVFRFLTDNTLGLVAALSLVALPIIKGIIPSMDEWQKSSKKKAKQSKRAAKDYGRQIDEQVEALTRLNMAEEEASAIAAATAEKKGTARGADIDFMTGTGGDQKAAGDTLRDAEKQMKKHGEIRRGTLQGYNKKELQDMRRSYDMRVAASVTANKKIQRIHSETEIKFKKNVLIMQRQWALFTSGMAKMARKTAGAIDKAFSAMSWIGMISLLISAGQSLWEWLFPKPAEQKAAEEAIESLTDKYSDLAGEMINAEKVRRDKAIGGQGAVIAGNQMQSLDTKDYIEQIDRLQGFEGMDDVDKMQESLLKTMNAAAATHPEFKLLADNIQNFSGPVSEDLKRALIEASSGTIDLGQRIEQLPQNLSKTDKAYTTLIESMIKPTGAETLIHEESKNLETLEDKLKEAHAAKLRRQDDVLKIGQTEAQFLKEQMALRAKFNEMTDDPTALLNNRLSNAMSLKDITYDNYKQALFRFGIEAKITEEQYNQALAIERAAQASKDAVKEEDKIEKMLKSRQGRLSNIQQWHQDMKEAILNRGKAEAKSIRSQTLGLTIQGKLVNLKHQEYNVGKRLEKATDKHNQAVAALADFESKAGDAKAQAKDKDVIRGRRAVKEAYQELDVQKAIAEIARQKLAYQRAQLETQLKYVSALAKEKNEIASIALARANAAHKAKMGGGTWKSVGEQRTSNVTQGERQLKVDEAVQTRVNDLYNLEVQRQFEELKGMRGAEGSGIAASVTDDALLTRATDSTTLSKFGTDLNTANANVQNTKNDLDYNKNLFDVITNQNVAAAEQLNMRAQSSFFNKEEQLFIDMKIAAMDRMGPLNEEQEASLKEQAKQQYQLNKMIEMKQGISDSITNNMESALMSIVDGSKSAKEAFRDMAKAILADIAKMIIKLLVQKAIMAAMGLADGGVTPAAPASGISAAAGGVFGPRRGKNYTSGGIARGPTQGYPATLHGNEAVVPLPHNRKIPVELMGGAGGQQNNVNVTVNMSGAAGNGGDNAGGQQQGDSQAANQLGSAIAKAVQVELQNQKRSGGILNPYGVA